jgi:hypothetical protein
MGINRSAFRKIKTWEHHKSLTNFHFDLSKPPTGNEFQHLCKFSGDWSAGIDRAIDECVEYEVVFDKSILSKLDDLDDRTDTDSEVIDMPIVVGKERLSLLYWVELYMANREDEFGNIIATKNSSPEYKPFFDMVEKMGYTELHSLRICFQRMGQMSPWHVDRFPQYYKESSFLTNRYNKIAKNDHLTVRRTFVALSPYDYGQIWQFGNAVWKDYQPGDCITFDWKNMPHATTNNGYSPRINLQITGFVGDKFNNLLNSPLTTINID